MKKSVAFNPDMMYNSRMMIEKVTTMWNDFSDFELAELCFTYGIQDDLELKFDNRFKLVNRTEIEELLTAIELEMAFGE